MFIYILFYKIQLKQEIVLPSNTPSAAYVGKDEEVGGWEFFCSKRQQNIPTTMFLAWCDEYFPPLRSISDVFSFLLV